MNPELLSAPDGVQASNDANDDAVAAVSSPTLGELMIAARERWNLSAGDVARQLRLGLRQVEALEENRFEMLPGNTFVRGFIRNYAKVVQVDPVEFLDAYERSRPQIQAPEIVAQNEHIDFTRKPIPKWVWYIAGGVVVAVLAPLFIYLALHDDESLGGTALAPAKPVAAELTPQPPRPSVEPAAEQGVAMPLDLPPAQAISLGDPAPAPSQDAVAPPAAAVLTPPAARATVAGMPVLKLHFAGDAWVEIRDKSGKKIFSQLSRAGSEQVVQGEPPLSLIVGDAAKVKITYNDKPVDLTPHVKKTVARLTLE